VTFNRNKFVELVLYVADKSVEDPNYGATKLNKILFFADFLAYTNLGQSITGAAYQKLEHGPAPRELLPIQRQLIERGDAALIPRGSYGYRQKRLTALREPDLSVFSPEEIALVDEVLDQLIHHRAADVSMLSHRWSAGWAAVEQGETIPYETAFWAPHAVNEDDIKRAQELADEHGWVGR
jgi:hypothetical protein